MTETAHAGPCLGSGLTPAEESLAGARDGAGTGEILTGSADYGAAHWRGAPNSAYTEANRPHSHPIQLVVIHFTQGGSFPVAFQPAGLTHYGVSSQGIVDQYLGEAYIAWHAGNWDVNCRSIGIEHVGWGRPQDWTDAMLRSSARLTASLCKKHKIPIDRKHIIGHSEVPGADHTDVGPHFPWARYVALVKEAAGGTVPPKPGPPGIVRPEYVYAVAWAPLDVKIASAAVKAMKAAGYPKAVFMVTLGDISQASEKALAQPDRPALVIGGPTVAKLHPKAREVFARGDHTRLLDCVGNGLDATIEETAWRLAFLAPRIGVDKVKLLEVYRHEVGQIRQPGPLRPTPKEALWLTNWRKAKPYGGRLVARNVKYWCWDGGSLDRTVNGRPGCKNGPPPPIGTITKMFCADFPTLLMRYAGLSVPLNHQWPGGTRSFRLMFEDVMVPFKLSEMREADAGFVDFESAHAPEGHIGVSLEDGPDGAFAQSWATDCVNLEPGLTADWTIRQSHDGGYYTHRIPREFLWTPSSTW